MRATDWEKVGAGLKELLYGTIVKGLYYVGVSIFMIIDFIGITMNWLWGGDHSNE